MGLANVYDFRTYLKARFPVPSLAFYTLLTLFAINSVFEKSNYGKAILLGLIYLLFLFYLRVLDEFKDFAYDSKEHADRPVQSGLVSLSFLCNVGLVDLFLFLLLGFLVSPLNVFFLLVLTLFYSFLMYKEFFIRDLLRKRTLLYLLSHQVVLIPLFLFFYSVFYGDVWPLNSVSHLSLFLYTVLPALLIEVGRKLDHRLNTRGEKTDDTYAYAWGERTSIRVYAFLVFLGGSFSLSITGFSLSFTVVIFSFSLFVFVGSFLFHKVIMAKSMFLTVVTAFLLPFFLIL